jgi:cell division protein FtsX
MKNKILLLAVTSFMAGTMFIGCQSSASKVQDAQDKVQDAKDKVVEANQDLDQALRDSILQFRTQSEATFNDREKSIADFKARIANEKDENRVKYQKKLAELEQQNTDMKKQLDDYKEAGKDKWDTFKVKFSKDMNNLGTAFKNFTVKGK